MIDRIRRFIRSDFWWRHGDSLVLLLGWIVIACTVLRVLSRL